MIADSKPQSHVKWVIEYPNTANEFARRLYDHQGGAGRPPRPGQEVLEGSLEDFEVAKKKADSRAFSRCGFCDGPKPCLRDD